MKQISLAVALLLLTPPVSFAAEAPTPRLQPPSPLACAAGHTPSDKPGPLWFPSSCQVAAQCPPGEPEASCSSQTGGCLYKPGCYVICEDNHPIFCQGKEYDPDCAIT